MSGVCELRGGAQALCLQLAWESQGRGRERGWLWLHAGNLRLPLTQTVTGIETGSGAVSASSVCLEFGRIEIARERALQFF